MPRKPFTATCGSASVPFLPICAIAALIGASLVCLAPYIATADEQADKAPIDCYVKATDYALEPPSLTKEDDAERIVVPEQLVYLGECYDLLPVYADKKSALESIEKKASGTLNFLKEQYNLEDLSENNWFLYQEKLEETFDSSFCPEWYKEDNEEIYTLRAFFDIYENDSDNLEIRQCVTALRETLKPDSPNNQKRIELEEELSFLLPYQQDLCHIASKPSAENASQNATSTYSVTKAIAYAKSHATNINKGPYDYFKNGDCTNFASQILEKAGKQQIVKSSTKSGWWHKRTVLPRGLYNHTHSLSWTVADTFCNYMGVKFKTRSDGLFSKSIKAGDIIAADWHNDGKFDHVGFVVDTRKSFANKNRNEFLVAQHTTNYLLWTNASGNHWAKVGVNGGLLARIYR